MKMYKQRGVVTILTSVILLIGVTLVAFMTGRTVLMEQKITANEYRTKQASAAANAAMNYGAAYFDAGGGFDHNGDGTVDVIAEITYSSTDANQDTFATIEFENTVARPITRGGRAINYTCIDVDGTMKAGMLIAIGFSDDREARRVITQCVGTIPVLGDSGPEQPLISKGSVGLTGNASVINRFSNATIWAGNKVDIGNSVAMNTYLKPEGVDLDPTDSTDLAVLINPDSSVTAQKVSSTRLGNGVDVIDGDPNLGNLTGDEFFRNFFAGGKAEIEGMAVSVGQRFDVDTIGANVSSTLEGLGGVIWVEGDASMTSQVTIGSEGNAAIVIINGNLSFNGPTINGLLYVVGQMDVAGNATVSGSAVVEGNPAMVPAGEAPVEGNGTLNLVYNPYVLGSGEGTPPAGTTTLIAGSWRDW